jgi:hypothetical protein
MKVRVLFAITTEEGNLKIEEKLSRPAEHWISPPKWKTELRAASVPSWKRSQYLT